MRSVRKILFQIHLWTGLIGGLLFVVLGVSGSALVYPSLLQMQAPAPKAVAQGSPLPLEQVIANARAATPQSEGRPVAVTLARAAGDAIVVQFGPQAGARGAQAGGRGQTLQAAGGRNNGAANRQPAGGRGPAVRRGGNSQIFVDPVSGQVLATRTIVNSPVVGLARQLHEAMLLGRFGRSLVAWLGVGMFFLGLSGLYLWWPKKGQWKFAFGVRRNARGFRIYREVHGMMGVWFWLVFLVVTATSLPLGFQSVLTMVTGNAPRGLPPGAGQVQQIEAGEGATPLRLAELIADAEKAGGAKPVAVTVPAQPNRPVNVVLETGFGDFTPGVIAVNPYTGAVLTRPGQTGNAGVTRRTIEQLHGGAGFGPVWKFLVFVSGFLPLIFVVTGLMMWLKKRQNRSAVKRPVSAAVRKLKPAAAVIRA